jgi:hypothetical protein
MLHETFNPGTGANQYQVRRWDNDAIVFTGTLQQWNGGATHTQSGDRGWWFDFSSVTTAGSYYVFDVANNIGSFRFDIGDNVYDEVLSKLYVCIFINGSILQNNRLTLIRNGRMVPVTKAPTRIALQQVVLPKEIWQLQKMFMVDGWMRVM